MLQENVNGFRREIEALREKNQKMTVTHQRQEEIIHTMTQDLREASEKLAMAEVKASVNRQQVFGKIIAYLIFDTGVFCLRTDVLLVKI